MQTPPEVPQPPTTSTPPPQPGAGQPLVAGPPASVSGKMGGGKLNVAFLIAGIVGLAVIVVVVVLILHAIFGKS